MDWIDLTPEEWRDKCIAANARADCYEEQMKDLAVALESKERQINIQARLNTVKYSDLQNKIDFLENQVTDLDAALQIKKRTIVSLEKQLKRISEMHKTEVRENRELWEENQKLKGSDP